MTELENPSVTTNAVVSGPECDAETDDVDTNSPSVIGADALGRDFGAKSVLQDVTFEVPRGRICALLGRNGSGKTTLLKLLYGLIEPTHGRSQLLSDSHWPRSDSALRQTGCVLDGFEPPGGTRLRNLLSLSAAAGPNFDDSRAAELLHSHGLRLKQTWSTLSKGQKRWVLLVMQLCCGCSVLLLDEPADGLDPQTRIELYQLLRREANDRELTALVATHVITDVERVADDVCILDGHRILLYAAIEDLREQVQVVDIESAPDTESALPDGIELLHQVQDETTQMWLRDKYQRLDKHAIAGEVRRRRATLEELFLAVTS